MKTVILWCVGVALVIMCAVPIVVVAHALWTLRGVPF